MIESIKKFNSHSHAELSSEVIALNQLSEARDNLKKIVNDIYGIEKFVTSSESELLFVIHEVNNDKTLLANNQTDILEKFEFYRETYESYCNAIQGETLESTIARLRKIDPNFIGEKCYQESDWRIIKLAKSFFYFLGRLLRSPTEMVCLQERMVFLSSLSDRKRTMEKILEIFPQFFHTEQPVTNLQQLHKQLDRCYSHPQLIKRRIWFENHLKLMISPQTEFLIDPKFSEIAQLFSEFDSKERDYAVGLFPEGSLIDIAQQSLITIRKVSPLLLGECPYKPTDSFLVKCKKYVISSTRAYFSMTDKIQADLKTYHAAVRSLSQKADVLNEKIFGIFNKMRSLQFELEVNKIFLNPKEISIEDLIPLFVDSYRVVLNSRKYYMEGKTQLLLDPDYRKKLCELEEIQLQEQAQSIRLKPQCDLQKRNEMIQQRLEKLFQKKTDLTEKLHTIQDFLFEGNTCYNSLAESAK